MGARRERQRRRRQVQIETRRKNSLRKVKERTRRAKRLAMRAGKTAEA